MVHAQIRSRGIDAQSGASVSEIVYAEDRLREAEQEIEALEAQWEPARKYVREAVMEDIRASLAKKLGQESSRQVGQSAIQPARHRDRPRSA